MDPKYAFDVALARDRLRIELSNSMRKNGGKMKNKNNPLKWQTTPKGSSIPKDISAFGYHQNSIWDFDISIKISVSTSSNFNRLNKMIDQFFSDDTELYNPEKVIKVIEAIREMNCGVTYRVTSSMEAE